MAKARDLQRLYIFDHSRLLKVKRYLYALILDKVQHFPEKLDALYDCNTSEDLSNDTLDKIIALGKLKIEIPANWDNDDKNNQFLLDAIHAQQLINRIILLKAAYDKIVRNNHFDQLSYRVVKQLRDITNALNENANQLDALLNGLELDKQKLARQSLRLASTKIKNEKVSICDYESVQDYVDALRKGDLIKWLQLRSFLSEKYLSTHGEIPTPLEFIRYIRQEISQTDMNQEDILKLCHISRVLKKQKEHSIVDDLAVLIPLHPAISQSFQKEVLEQLDNYDLNINDISAPQLAREIQKSLFLRVASGDQENLSLLLQMSQQAYQDESENERALLEHLAIQFIFVYIFKKSNPHKDLREIDDKATAQDYINALRNNDLGMLFNFMSYISNKYTPAIQQDISAEEMAILISHELAGTDITLRDLKKLNAIKQYLRNLHHNFHCETPFNVGYFDCLIDTLLTQAARVIAAKEQYHNQDIYLSTFEINNIETYREFLEATSFAKVQEENPESHLTVASMELYEKATSKKDDDSFNLPTIDLSTFGIASETKKKIATQSLGSLLGISSVKFMSHLVSNYKINEIDDVIQKLCPNVNDHDKRIFNFKFCEYIMQNLQEICAEQAQHYNNAANEITLQYIQRLKSYIEHPDTKWPVTKFFGHGGKTITFKDSTSKVVPEHIAKIYEALNPKKKQDSRDTYNKIIQIGLHPSNKFAFFTRAKATQDFYDSFKNAPQVSIN